MKILIVLTSHDELGTTGRKTGFWLEELAAPYYRFKEVAPTSSSPPQGRQAAPGPQEQRTHLPDRRDPPLRGRPGSDGRPRPHRPARLRLGRRLRHRFLPRRPRPLWDLAEDPTSTRLVESILRAGKPLALVCHAPGTLRHATNPDGTPLVQGRKITGFTNGEEADGLTDIVPFLVEDELKKLGADYSKTENWQPYVVVDGLLITGQSPASSGPAADALLTLVTLVSQVDDARA